MHPGIMIVNSAYAPGHLPHAATARDDMHMRKTRHFIKEWRLKKELNQAQLADKAGVTQSMVSRVENGRSSYDEEFLERVAIAMNVTPADLIMRDPSDPEGLWSITDQLTPVERAKLVEFAKILKAS